MKPCERCRKMPEGEYGLHDYCEFCSRDLCPECMTAGRCPDSLDGQHKAYQEDET